MTPDAASWGYALVLGLGLLAATPGPAAAHRSGCHRWHSCPSDRGTYTRGDLGHCSGCPDNEYCELGQPRVVQDPGRPSQPSPGIRPGVPPKSAWECPLSEPIKGNFTTYSGERCIYHVPGGEFYGKTNPERCYAMEQDAVKDGCRRSKQ